MFENLPKIKEPKVVGSIDLSKFENKAPKKENIRISPEIKKSIHEAMPKNARIINERVSLFENAPNELVDEKGQIYIHEYSQDRKGYYKPEEVQKDIKFQREQGKNFREEREQIGPIGEDAIFILMNKIAKDRYVVVKSSPYDDYNRGADLVLVDTETGKTVCAFDETINDDSISKKNQDELSPYEKKMKRATETLQKGKGMDLKYGMEIKNNKIRLRRVQDIPPLFLKLEKDILLNMLQVMDFDINSDVSTQEIEAIESMIKSAQEQISELSKYQIEGSRLSYEAVDSFINYLNEELLLCKENKKAS